MKPEYDESKIIITDKMPVPQVTKQVTLPLRIDVIEYFERLKNKVSIIKN